MRKITITLLLSASALLCFAQEKEKQDTLIIPHSKAIQLQQVLSFSFQWLPKSDAPAKDVGTVEPIIQELYGILWPAPKPKDENKPVKSGKP